MILGPVAGLTSAGRLCACYIKIFKGLKVRFTSCLSITQNQLAFFKELHMIFLIHIFVSFMLYNPNLFCPLLV